MYVGHLALAAALLTATAACSDSPTSPSSATTTTIPATTIAEPTVTEDFNGTVRVSGAAFYSYNVVENGTVRVTLSRVSGTNIPSSVWLGLGIGQPSGEECSTTLTVNGPSGSTAQLSGTYSPGVYCVRVWDLGYLIAPAQFAISIAHP
jgi:hypothetical protein